jgi:hypothetical protein
LIHAIHTQAFHAGQGLCNIMAPNHFDGFCRAMGGADTTSDAPVRVNCRQAIFHFNRVNRASIHASFAPYTGFEIGLPNELTCHQKIPWHSTAFVIAECPAAAAAIAGVFDSPSTTLLAK